MIEETKEKTKVEDIYLAIIHGLKFSDDNNLTKMWDRAIAIKTELNNAGFRIVRKPS